MQETRHDEVTAEGPRAKREKHDTTPDLKKELEELKKKYEESQTEKEELKTEKEELKKKYEESQKKYEENEALLKRFPRMDEIVNTRKLCPPPNESNSSAHTKTGHRPASTEATLVLPEVLGCADKFWSHRKEPPTFPKSLNSEGSSSLVVYAVLNMIMDPLSNILGFPIHDVLDIQACISLLDAIPDLGLLGPNKIIASAVEIKKEPKLLRSGTKSTEWGDIFGSDTEVAGEVFEQLYLVNSNNLGSGGVGLLTTAENYMLVSLDGDIRYDIEKIKNFFSKRKGKTESTPDRMQTAIFKTEDLSDEQRDFKVTTLNIPGAVPDEYMKRDKDGNIKKDRNGNDQVYKYGRVAAIASQETAAYSHYASKVLSMDTEPKKTLNLLAVFVILTLRNLMNYIENENSENIMNMTHFSARFVSEPSVLSLTAVTLSRPIDFLCPSTSCDSKVFYAIKQLGFGSHGVCCLAFNMNGAACVLKFIHKHVIGTSNSEMEAKEEAAMWGRIYKEKYGITASLLQVNFRLIIVMPYLQIPSTHREKLALCKDDTDSKLYRGLKEFCDAGYIHKELHWHHVGVIPSADSDSDNPCLLCDLENISEHLMSEVEKEKWVDEAFTALKNRLNLEQENCLQTPKK